MHAETAKPRPNSQQWVQEILKDPAKFEAAFVVHTDSDVLFVSKKFVEANDWLNEHQEEFGGGLRLFPMPNDFGQVRLRMLKIKSLSAGEWMPTFIVKFFLLNSKTANIEMLVDSGADVSFIPFQIGKVLGFEKSFGETSLLASGVWSKVPYLIRKGRILIEETELTIRLLWGQDEEVTDILLGRLDVFDHFDVTFSQYHQRISFLPVQTSA